MKVAIVVFDQFTDLDLFLPWDLLNRVAWPVVGGREEWQVTICGTAESHVSVSGLRIPVSGTLEDANRADAVLIASGKGLHALLDDPAYLARFQLDPQRQLIGSVCSGALLLAALGLLEGQAATTYPTSREKLATRYAIEVVDKSFVKNGNVATAAGCLAGIEMVRWMITELVGADMAKEVLASVQPVSGAKVNK